MICLKRIEDASIFKRISKFDIRKKKKKVCKFVISCEKIMQKIGRDRISTFLYLFSLLARVSVQEVESLWGDCRFIPADWGS